MAIYIAKPPDPAWNPDEAPAGCKLYLPLTEGAGAVVRDLTGNGQNGTFAGAPTWQRGVYGPQLGGFTSSNYATVPYRPSLAIAAPLTFSVMVKVTSLSDTFGVIADRVANTSWGSGYGFYLEGTQYHFWVGSYNSRAVAAAAALGTHVLTGYWDAATIALYVDGRLAASTASTAAPADNTSPLSLGFDVAGDNAFSGGLIAVSLSTGSAPDPAALADDWLSGRFSAVRPTRRVYSFAPPAPVTGTGSAMLGAVTAAGSGAVSDAGSGFGTLGHISASGSGAVSDAGAGASTLGHVAASGSGAVTLVGSGSPALSHVSGSGVGAVTNFGTGSATLTQVSASGTGSVAAPIPPVGPGVWARRRRRLASAHPLIMAGWDARPMADDDNPFGVDPEQTFGTN